ncbi:tyrosine phosphatase family-domain-containing protein [Pilobolus umbonatus]|nr:tyrosine phosphatase family-domain-containing protein [Pilobolus umbonatus]
MSKISIHNDHDEVIVGILEKKDEIDVGRTHPRLILVCHGVLGHKDYLFQRLLAQKLPYSSFRFDFRGNGESSGEPGYANIVEDIEDIHTVADYFENQGYEIFAVIGHSRGSVAGLKFAVSRRRPLPFFINISARYKMNDNQIYRNRPEIGAGLKEHGYFMWRVKQRDRIVQVKVTQAEVDKFYNWSNEHISRMSVSTCVLTIHGLQDTIVPPYNAAMIANKIPNHTLVLLPEADHNFKGKFEEVVEAACLFLSKHEHDNHRRAYAMGQNTGLVIPRWVDVDGVSNFRDIGGWPLKDGSGYIRERTVFRSGKPDGITPEGCATLSHLNVKAIFDFRLPHEMKEEDLSQRLPGVNRFEYNLYANVVKSISDYIKYLMVFLDGPEGFAKAYMTILESGKVFLGEVFRYMIRELSTASKASILVHCTAGKDRTGLFIMVLLGLCYVDEEIIAKEYDLSRLGYFDYEKDVKAKAKELNIREEKLRAALSTS